MRTVECNTPQPHSNDQHFHLRVYLMITTDKNLTELQFELNNECWRHRPINKHRTHWRAYDTLSRFAFVTMFSWQSWNSSLSLTRRQGSSQWGSSARKSRNHGELLRCMIIKNSHSAGTHFPYVLFK